MFESWKITGKERNRRRRRHAVRSDFHLGCASCARGGLGDAEWADGIIGHRTFEGYAYGRSVFGMTRCISTTGVRVTRSDKSPEDLWVLSDYKCGMPNSIHARQL